VDNYELRIKSSAVKELEALQDKDRRRIIDKIRELSVEPRPRGCEKLTGQNRLRIRQGDFRILFEVDDGLRIVTIVKIGHRRDVYR
jgi:mRNA interferase RelE/StbE